MLIRRIVLLASLLISGTSFAGDSALTSCRREREAAERLAACNAVIKSPEFTAAERAIALRTRGEMRLKAGATGESISDLSAALSLAPNDAAAYAARARAFLTASDLDRAVTDFSAALQQTTEPKGKSALLIGRGHALFVKGLFDLAIADFNEAIQLNPRSASAHNHRGLAWRKKGDALRAIEDYTAAITLNPVYALAYSNRGHVYEAQGGKEEAIRDFNRALLLDGSITSAYERLKALKPGSTSIGQSERLIAEGRDIAERICAFCHAVGQTGRSPNTKAPAFRTFAERHPELSLREPLTRGIAAPHEEMPKFELTIEEVDSLVAYVNSLPE